MALMSIVVCLSYLANAIDKNPERCNCWLHALWRWDKYGGYIAVRKAVGVHFFKWLPVPHCLWIRRMDRKHIDVEQYAPIKRERAEWLPWFVGYFKGSVVRFDANHNADIEAYKRDNENG